MVPRIFSKIRGGGIPTPAGGPRRAARGRTDVTQHTVYLSRHGKPQLPLRLDCTSSAEWRAGCAELLFGAADLLCFVIAGTNLALLGATSLLRWAPGTVINLIT